MQKLLIATNSQLLTETLSDALCEQFYIVSCDTGPDAVQMLCEFRPDVVALDLMLPGFDGIDVLKMAKGLGVCSRVVAFSTYISGYITAALSQLEVCCLLQLPCNPRYLAARILDVSMWEKEAPENTRLELKKLLTRLGFKLNTSGFRVAEECVELYLQNPKQALTTGIYPEVAKRCNGTTYQVERALRTAIASAWARRDEQMWRMYFPTGKNGKVIRPTNAEFLAKTAMCLSNVTEPEDMLKQA